MNTESRRKASAAYHARREAEGLKKVTLWLSPDARAKLDAMKAAAGSKDKAAELAIMAWGGSGPKAEKTAPASQKPAKATAPEPEPKSHVELPVFERKPFNPQPKRGKK